MDNLKLIDLLVQNPRASITDLADILGETEETVDRAKKDLEEQKIICGYHTMVNWDKANIDHVDAIIGVSAKPERGSGYDKIAERIAFVLFVIAALMSAAWILKPFSTLAFTYFTFAPAKVAVG